MTRRHEARLRPVASQRFPPLKYPRRWFSAGVALCWAKITPKKQDPDLRQGQQSMDIRIIMIITSIIIIIIIITTITTITIINNLITINYYYPLRDGPRIDWRRDTA